MFVLRYNSRMLPADYTDFFVAVLTASASFIGLLFVAMTLITDKSGKSKKQITTENILAEGSYIALLDLFFVSLVALIPHAKIGIVMLLMGLLGISNAFRLAKVGLRDGVSRGILGISSITYAVQVIYGIFILFNQDHVINTSLLLAIIFILFGSALGRAWELTGIPNHD